MGYPPVFKDAVHSYLTREPSCETTLKANRKTEECRMPNVEGWNRSWRS
jgi:hypothetical protein